jgi:hypothetical protein
MMGKVFLFMIEKLAHSWRTMFFISASIAARIRSIDYGKQADAVGFNAKSKKFERRAVGWGHFFNPLAPYMILWEGIRSIVDRLNAPGKLSQADAEKIRKMIEAGRNQRVDAMEMERSRNVAMGFSVNNVEGAAVTVGSKGQTKYVMKRKDKDDE